MSNLNKELYEQNLAVLEKKKLKNKKKGFQINFLSDEAIVAIIATIKMITGESQKSFVEKAILEKAQRDYPEFNFSNKE